MRVIFDAGPQRWKIWFVLLICVICGAGGLLVGGYMLLNYGLHPDDGGVLKPLTSRILMGSAFALPGAAILAAILLYLQLYVTRIEEDDADDGFRVTVAGFGHPRTIHPQDVAGLGYNDGISNAGGISVNAPWYSLRLHGRRFGLIIDLQGDFIDQPAVERLLEGKRRRVAAAPRPSRKLQGRKHRR